MMKRSFNHATKWRLQIAATTAYQARTYTIFFCDDFTSKFNHSANCRRLISDAFGKDLILSANAKKNHFPQEQEKLVSRAVKDLVQNIQNTNRSRRGEPHRFVIFAAGEGTRIVEIALKEISHLKVDIHVYSFGGTTTLISKKLATKARHYVFYRHFISDHFVLSRMYSIDSKMKDKKMSYEVAVFTEASALHQQNNVEIDGSLFFDSGFKYQRERLEGYLSRYRVSFLDKSALPFTDSRTYCQFFSYANIIQQIAYQYKT